MFMDIFAAFVVGSIWYVLLHNAKKENATKKCEYDYTNVADLKELYELGWLPKEAEAEY